MAIAALAALLEPLLAATATRAAGTAAASAAAKTGTTAAASAGTRGAASMSSTDLMANLAGMLGGSGQPPTPPPSGGATPPQGPPQGPRRQGGPPPIPPPAGQPTQGGGGGMDWIDFMQGMGPGAMLGLAGRPISRTKSPYSDGRNAPIRGAASRLKERYTGVFKDNINPMVMPHKKIIGTFLAIYDTAKDLPAAIEDWGDSLKESQRNLTAFSGTIAAAFAESERRGIIRKMQSGAATGSSTQFMVTAFDDLKDSLRPIRDVLTDIYNVLAGSIAYGLTFGVGVLKGAASANTTLNAIWDLLNWFRDNNNEPTPFINFMEDVNAGAGKKKQNRGVPKR